MSWQIILVPEVRDWLLVLDERDRSSVREAVEVLADRGPGLGRPLADRIHGSSLHNLKELRPASSGRSEMRILYVFDPERQAVLLVAGDKAGRWSSWYTEAIKLAEERYDRHLKSLEETP